MHSPWGLIYSLAKELGWTWNEILWGTSKANMMLMMADRPNYKRREDQAIPDTGKGLAQRFKKRKVAP